jgi:hypothetical protein
MKLRFLILLLLCAPAWATFKLIQHVPGTSTSSSGIKSLGVTVSSTGSGDVIIVVFAAAANTKTLSGVTCRPNACTGANAFVHCSSCVGAYSTAVSTDIYYTLDSEGGDTTITPAFTDTAGSALSVDIFEYSFSGSSVAVDSGSPNGGNVHNSTHTLRGGVALTIDGSNDLIVQGFGMSSAVACRAVSSPYSTTADFVRSDAGAGSSYSCYAASANTASGTAPTWTFAGNSFSAGSALAIAEFLAVGPTNPTSYNAITNTNTYSGAAPTLGIAGTTTTDPDFGTKVMRVTQSGSCSAASGHSFASNEGTGWSRTINSNDTAMLLNLDNGDWYVQPVTLSSSGMSLNGSCVEVVPPLTGTEINFYATNPSLVYGLDSDGAHFDSYKWSTATKTQVFDVATIDGFTPATLFLATCDGNDSWCATSSDTQNNGTQATFYNIKTKATEVVNIANATVQIGSASPVAMDNATSSLLAGCGIHEIIPGLDGAWWTITLDRCTSTSLPHDFDNLFWQLGTHHVTYIHDTNEVGGHEAMGVGATYTAAPGSPPGCTPYSNYWTVLWNLANLGDNPGNWVGAFTCSSIWGSDDNHFSWLNNYDDIDANSYPILSLTTAATTNTGAPYEWELDMLNMASANATRKLGVYRTWPSSETVWRIAHTYNDPVNSQCAAQGYQSPNISSDGKYISFTSDWLGGTGTGGCTNSRRTDVFVARLPIE